MNSVKILHCADFHIGAAEHFLGTAAGQRQIETLMTFEKTVDLAKERGVQVIAIAGDLFDSNRAGAQWAKAVLEKIASVPEIQVVFAAGNHDPFNAESPFKTEELPANLTVLDTKDCVFKPEGLPLRVYGRSFEEVYLRGEERFSILPPEDDIINLMVQHGDLKSDLQSDYNAITPAFVKACHMDYLALGHVHKRTPVGKLGGTSFAYCGCPEGQGFDELDERGVYIGEITKNGCEMEFVPLSRRRHLVEEVEVTGEISSAAISERVLAAIKAHGADYADHLYKVILTGTLPEEVIPDLNEITGRVAAEVYFVKVIDRTEPEIDTEKLAGEISLKGLFVKKMLEKEQNAPDAEKEAYRQALKLGLRAFSTEVEYREDQ